MATRLPAAEKVQRDAAVVADRARGLSWATIADRHGLSERHCREIWSEGLDVRLYAGDPLEALADVIAQLDAAIEDFALLAETTTNESVKLGALKARMAAASERFGLMRACGLLPRDLGHFRHEVEAERVARLVLDAFASFGVPLEAKRAVLKALRGEPAPSGLPRSSLMELEAPVRGGS